MSLTLSTNKPLNIRAPLIPTLPTDSVIRRQLNNIVHQDVSITVIIPRHDNMQSIRVCKRIRDSYGRVGGNRDSKEICRCNSDGGEVNSHGLGTVRADI